MIVCVDVELERLKEAGAKERRIYFSNSGWVPGHVLMAIDESLSKGERVRMPGPRGRYVVTRVSHHEKRPRYRVYGYQI